MTWRTFTLSGVTVRPTRDRTLTGPQDGRCYAVARWTEGDARPSRSLGWCTLDEARAAAARIATRAPERVPTVAALLDVWIVAQEERLEAGEIRPETLRGYSRDRRTLAALCGKLNPSAVTSATLADLATRIARLGTHAATTTDRLLVVLCGALAWGRERDLVTGRPVRWERRSRPATAQRAQPEADLDAAIQSMPDDSRRLFVEVLRATGMRPGELAILRSRHVHPIPDGVILQVPDEPGAKTGARRVPVVDDPVLVARILALRDADPDARLWPVAHPDIAARRALAALGVPWRLVTLRKTRSTALLAAGAPPKAYEDMMGHGFALALRVYASAQDEDKIEAARLVGQLTRSRALSAT